MQLVSANGIDVDLEGAWRMLSQRGWLFVNGYQSGVIAASMVDDNTSRYFGKIHDLQCCKNPDLFKTLMTRGMGN